MHFFPEPHQEALRGGAVSVMAESQDSANAANTKSCVENSVPHNPEHDHRHAAAPQQGILGALPYLAQQILLISFIEFSQVLKRIQRSGLRYQNTGAKTAAPAQFRLCWPCPAEP